VVRILVKGVVLDEIPQFVLFQVSIILFTTITSVRDHVLGYELHPIKWTHS
jgi:hypothetical protein